MNKLIYVAGPYSPGHGRSREANLAAAFLVGSQVRWTGFTPLVAHLAVLPFAPDDSRKFSMRERLTIMRRTDAVVTVPGWQDDRDSRLEVWIAHRWGLPVMTLEELMANGLPSKAKAA
jgi:hypothetical protein